MEPELLRLQRIEVDDLFGIYDHTIDLNTTDRVTLLHGANGVGKTTALQMVNALMRNNMAYFGRIPFTRFRLGFMDGSTLELKATGAKGEKSGKLTLRTEGTPAHTRDVRLATSEAETLAERVDFLKPHDNLANAWIDIRDDEVLTESDVVMRFGRRLAGSNRSRQHATGAKFDVAEPSGDGCSRPGMSTLPIIRTRRGTRRIRQFFQDTALREQGRLGCKKQSARQGVGFRSFTVGSYAPRRHPGTVGGHYSAFRRRRHLGGR